MKHFHAVSMIYTCYNIHCDKPGTHKVIGPGNAEYGRYCEEHAKERAEELERNWVPEEVRGRNEPKD